MDPCSRAGLPAPAPDGIDTLDATNTGGEFHGKPNSPVSLAAGVTISLTDDLVVVADGDLVIDGKIILPGRISSGGSPATITLVSLNGKVVIGPNGLVGLGVSTRGSDDPFLGQAGDGADGGMIRILGVNIDIQGRVLGNNGGDGGNASTVNVGTLVGLMGIGLARAAGMPWLARIFGGLLTATGGSGGKGGDVVLCALDSIHIGGRVEGGQGGWGGDSECRTIIPYTAIAAGGNGGDGGDVKLRGPTPTAKMQIFNDANLVGGDGGGGRKGTANANNGRAMGAWAQAAGGRAGKGGTVDFFGCVVVTAGFTKAGDGLWPGGDAEARGDKGASGLWGGQAGGSATATGGQGSRPGDTPLLPMATGQLQQGFPGGAGRGGNADAYAGVGGDGSTFLNTSGGASGTATAQGGANGKGTSPGAPVVFGPAGPSTTTGGVTSTATQAGMP